jgi:nucleoside-diphosphate-sugar epimerase
VVEIVREIVTRKLIGVYNVGTASPPTVHEVYSRLLERAGSRSRLVALPAWLFRGAAIALDRVGLSPLTPDQYQRLADPWILDPSKLLAAIKYRPRYDALRSMVDTYEAFVAPAASG